MDQLTAGMIRLHRRMNKQFNAYGSFDVRRRGLIGGFYGIRGCWVPARHAAKSF
jgi:hypothetical protein